MNIISNTIKAHRDYKQRQIFLGYEAARNAGCQMLEDAVAFFPNRLEAVTALRQILECNQDAKENHATANALSHYADEQERRETACQ